MRVDLDKNLDKDAFNNIKIAIGYPTNWLCVKLDK